MTTINGEVADGFEPVGEAFAANFDQHGDVEILVYGEIVQQMEALKDKSDILLIPFHSLFGREFVNSLAKKEELPRPKAVEHSQDTEDR